MSGTFIGATQFVTETIYEEDKDGLATFSQKTLISPSSSVPTPSMTKTIVVESEALRVVSVNVVSSAGSFKELQEVFQGQSSTRTLQQNAVNSTSSEPVETNENFIVSTDAAPSIVDLSGGALTAGEDINATTGGAVFDEDGRFLYFNKNAKGKLFGVTSYLSPTFSYRRSFTTTITPSLLSVGSIINAAEDFPQAQAGSTWLCTSIQYIQRGKTFEVSQEFRASGKSGWNVAIYGPAVAAPPAI